MSYQKLCPECMCLHGGTKQTREEYLSVCVHNLRQQLAEKNKQTAELEALISQIGMHVSGSSADLQEEIREAKQDYDKGQLEMARQISSIIEDEESRQLNLYEANYNASLEHYVKKIQRLKERGDTAFLQLSEAEEEINQLREAIKQRGISVSPELFGKQGGVLGPSAAESAWNDTERKCK